MDGEYTGKLKERAGGGGANDGCGETRIRKGWVGREESQERLGGGGEQGSGKVGWGGWRNGMLLLAKCE